MKDWTKKFINQLKSNEHMKNSYEDFMNKCALSDEEIQEMTEKYLNGNDRNVKSLLDELSLLVYKETYKNNVGKDFVDYNFNNCMLCDGDIHKLSQKYLMENTTPDGSYAFITVVEMRMCEKLTKKAQMKNKM